MSEADELADLSAVSEILTVAAIGVDAGGKVDIWNTAAARLFGWSEEEVIGKLLPQAIATVTSGHPGHVSTTTLAAKDRRIMTVICRFAARRTGGTIVIANDISDRARRKRENAELLEREHDADLRAKAESRFRELL